MDYTVWEYIKYNAVILATTWPHYVALLLAFTVKVAVCAAFAYLILKKSIDYYYKIKNTQLNPPQKTDKPE